MAITQISNNVILDGTILPAKLNVSSTLRTFLSSATSANLASAVSGTTGSGNLVFADSPTITNPIITSLGTAIGNPFTITTNYGTSTIANVAVRNQAANGLAAVSFLTPGFTPNGFIGYGNASSTQYTDQVFFCSAGKLLSISTAFGSRHLVMDATGSVTIGSGSSANSSAVLELSSTTRGFLPPRMTSTQRNAISGAAVPAGLTVFNSTDNALSVYTTVLSSWDNIFTARAASFTADTLRNACSNDTGTGNLVFSDFPSLSSPTLTAPTIATSLTLSATSYTYGTGAASAHREALGIVSASALIPVFYAYATLYTYDVNNQTTNRLWKNTTAIQTAPAITPSANFTKGTRGEIMASGSSYVFNNVNNPSPSTTYEAPYTLLVVLRPTAQTTNNGIFRHRNWDPNYTTGNLLQARFLGGTYQVLASKVVPTTDFVCIAYTGNNLVQRAAIWHNNEVVSGSSVVTMTANQSLIDMNINAGGGGAAGGVEFVAAQGLYGMLSEADLRAYAEAFFKSVIQ